MTQNLSSANTSAYALQYYYDPGADVWLPTQRTPQVTNQSAAAVIPALVGAAAGSNGADQANANARGLHLVIDITAITGTSPSLTVTIQAKDAVSGKYYTVLASAALTAVGTTVLRVYPGLTAAANSVANDVLPRDWRVVTAIAGTTPAVTATIAAAYLI